MKNMFRGGALLAAICFVFALAAKADDIHLCAVGSERTNGQRDCDFLGNNERDIEWRTPWAAWAVLTPLTDKSGNWNDKKTNLWSRLAPPVNCGKKCRFPKLNSAISQESGSGTGISPLRFNVTDISESAWFCSGEHISPSESLGTIFVAFTEDANENLTWVTPWSSSLVATPEPSTLFMVGGAGLAGLLRWLLMKAKA